MCRVSYILTMALTYPISCYVVRHVCYALYLQVRTFGKHDKYISMKTISFSTHLALTLPIFLSTLAISLFVRDLGVVMSLTGSLAGCGLSFVLPSLCYLKVTPYSLRFVWTLKREKPVSTAKLKIGVSSTSAANLVDVDKLSSCMRVRLRLHALWKWCKHVLPGHFLFLFGTVVAIWSCFQTISGMVGVGA